MALSQLRSSLEHNKISFTPGQRTFIWICVVLCLLPFVILSFFNVLAYDDYAAIDSIDRFGFIRTQQLIYTHWEGRFTSTFLSAACVKMGLLAKYYFLVFLLWSFCSWAAINFLLRSINAHLLNKAFSKSGIALASLILLILDLYAMAEMYSGIYWFSSTATYQTAFILFLILTGCLVRRFAVSMEGNGAGTALRPSRLRVILLDGAIVFLCILTVGSNETSAVALTCLLLLLMGTYRNYHLPVPKCMFIYLGAVLLIGSIVVFTSGTMLYRHQVIQQRQTQNGVVLAIVLFRTLSVFYYVLKEPLFWAVAAAAFILGLRVASISTLSGFAATLRSRPFFVRGVAAVTMLVLCTLVPVLWVTHGSIPERALNQLTALTAFGLLALVFLAGISNLSVAGSILPVRQVSKLIIIIIGCGLLASDKYKEAWGNVLSGYFYHSIQQERRQVFESARLKNERVATISSYESALEEKIRKVFPHGAPVTLKRWLIERPSLLYFDNEAEDHSGKYLLQYYGLDSIRVEARP